MEPWKGLTYLSLHASLQLFNEHLLYARHYAWCGHQSRVKLDTNPLPHGAHAWQLADKLIPSWNKHNEGEKHGPTWEWGVGRVVEVGVGVPERWECCCGKEGVPNPEQEIPGKFQEGNS